MLSLKGIDHRLALGDSVQEQHFLIGEHRKRTLVLPQDLFTALCLGVLSQSVEKDLGNDCAESDMPGSGNALGLRQAICR